MKDQTTETVARHEERLKSLEKRVEKNENIIEQIHELNSSVKSLTNEVKAQGTLMEKVVSSFDKRID